MKNQFSKTIFLVFIFLFIVNSVFGQVQKTTFKYQLGIGIPYLPLGRGTLPYVSLNISFKYIMNKNVIRSGLNFDRFKQSSGIAYQLLGNIGYERRFFGPKIQMLAGIDLGYLRNFMDTKNQYVLYHWGAGPVLGGVYNFHERFSVQTEIGLYYGNGKSVNNWIFRPRRETYFTSHRAFSLHLYYNFGKKE